MSLANPPVNAELLDYLAEGFVGNNFDMKWLHREITGSDTYQRSWRANETNRLDERNFSRAVPRRLPAEVAVDALAQATSGDERAAKYATSNEGRAIAIPGAGRRISQNAAYYALTVFGRSIRESNCDCDRSAETSLLQTVFLRNDEQTLAMIDGRDSWLQQVAKEAEIPFSPKTYSRGGKQRQEQSPATPEAAAWSAVQNTEEVATEWREREADRSSAEDHPQSSQEAGHEPSAGPKA